MQVGALVEDELLGLVEAEKPVDDERLATAHVEMVGDEAPEILGIEALHFEADDRAAAAALQHRLVQAHEIFGFFRDFDVAVAQDAERGRSRRPHDRGRACRDKAR